VALVRIQRWKHNKDHIIFLKHRHFTSKYQFSVNVLDKKFICKILAKNHIV